MLIQCRYQYALNSFIQSLELSCASRTQISVRHLESITNFINQPQDTALVMPSITWKPEVDTIKWLTLKPTRRDVPANHPCIYSRE